MNASLLSKSFQAVHILQAIVPAVLVLVNDVCSSILNEAPSIKCRGRIKKMSHLRSIIYLRSPITLAGKTTQFYVMIFFDWDPILDRYVIW